MKNNAYPISADQIGIELKMQLAAPPNVVGFKETRP
jgi:hypothetical protein